MLSPREFTFNGVSVPFDMTNPDFFRRYVASLPKIQKVELKEKGDMSENASIYAAACRNFIEGVMGEDAAMAMLPEDSAILAFDFMESMLAFGNWQLDHFLKSRERIEAVSRKTAALIEKAEGLMGEANETDKQGPA